MQDNNQELREFAINNEFCGYFRTSAKTGFNISESMEFLIRNIIKRFEDMKKKGVDNFEYKRCSCCENGAWMKHLHENQAAKKGCC